METKSDFPMLTFKYKEGFDIILSLELKLVKNPKKYFELYLQNDRNDWIWIEHYGEWDVDNEKMMEGGSFGLKMAASVTKIRLLWLKDGYKN